MPKDPYLEWAKATNFRYLPGDPAWLPILIKLKGTLTAGAFAAGNWGEVTPPANLKDWFIIPDLYLNLPAGLGPLQYCTAWIKQGFAPNLNDPDDPFAKVIEEFQLSDPVGPIAKAFAAPVQSAGSWTPSVIVGVIDDGLPFANVRFRESSTSTRMEFLWDQDQLTDLSKAQIDSALAACEHGGLVDEDEVYRRAGYSYADTGHKSWARRATHGAHVMDSACGLGPTQVAADSPRIIGVQLPSRVTADPSNGQLEFWAFLALIYIIVRADQVAAAYSSAPLPLVVNLSYGINHGPHDGTSLFEGAIDAVTVLRRALDNAPFTIVLPAGNSHLTRCHAHFQLDPGAANARTMEWRVLPDDATPSFLDIWLPWNASATQVEYEVETPDGTLLGPIQIGDLPFPWPSAVNPLFQMDQGVPVGSGRTSIRFSLAPTKTLDSTAAVAPSGTWQIKVTNVGATPLWIDSWIHRDDAPFGYPIRGRQSRFEDPLYERLDAQGRLSEVDGGPSYIKRDGSINGLATGNHTAVIGGCRRSNLRAARYSAGGPTLKPSMGGSAPRLGPDATAFSEWSVACQGMLATGTRSGSIIAVNGTSVSAPRVTRWIAATMAAANLGDRTEVGAQGAANPTPYILPKRGNYGYVDPGYSTIKVDRSAPV